jgi:sulfate transport system permease protein
MKLSGPTRITLRTVALLYLFGLLVVPIAVILYRTFERGIGAFIDSISTPAAISALNLSLLIVAIVVPINVVFGLVTALALVVVWCKPWWICRSPCRRLWWVCR